MKKFISMMIAASMLLSFCVTAAHAATSANPVINVYSEPYDGTDAPANYKPGDYDVYKVTYTTEGVDTSVDKITALTFKCTIDDASKIAAKSWQTSKTSGAASQRDANGFKSLNATGVVAGQGVYAWASVDGIDVFDWDTYPDGGTQETLPYAETLIYVTAGETVTLTYQTGIIGGDTTSLMTVNTYEDDNQRTFTTALQYKVNGTVGNTLTLGGSSTVPVSSVTISGATSATVGDSVALTATVLPGDATDPSVTWTKVSGDGAVSDAGVVTANSAGDIVVKATAGGVDSANYTVTFAAATVPVSSVAISGFASATVGDSVALSATVLPLDATDPSVTWTKVSGDGAVSATGVVTANSAGDIVVKATAGGVDSANFTVTFAAATVPATGVTINGGAAKAVVGDSVTFTATVDPSTSTDPVVWSVTGDGANVENGVVTSTKPGNVTVTATAGSVQDSKTVTFVDAPAAPEVENNYSSPAQIGGYNYITGNAAVAAPDFTNFVYKAWAKDEIGGSKHYFDATINDLLAGKFEGGATYNFILMVKSASHALVDCGIDALLK